MRPHTDVDAALYERGLAMHDRAEYTAAEALWRKAKRLPHEPANP